MTPVSQPGSGDRQQGHDIGLDRPDATDQGTTRTGNFCVATTALDTDPEAIR